MRAGWAGAALVVSGTLVGQGLRRRRHALDRRCEVADVQERAVREALLAAGAPTRPLVAVVIAALNEADSLPAVLAALPGDIAGLRLRPVVVDDGSRDDTAEVARRAGAVVARHRRNLGQGDALRTGFAVALSLDASVVVTMDADGQHDPDQLSALVAPIVSGNADYVQGSRFLGAYDDAGGARHAGIVGLTRLVNVIAGTEITDCANGFRAIRGSALAQMRLVEGRFSASEILVQARASELRMLEIPAHVRSRTTGDSRKPGGLRYPLGYLRVLLVSWARARAVGSGCETRATHRAA